VMVSLSFNSEGPSWASFGEHKPRHDGEARWGVLWTNPEDEEDEDEVGHSPTGLSLEVEMT
jgi:hypothetical protein